jgi:hypothetical protein
MLKLGHALQELELTCMGPVTVALLRALEYGIRVRSWTLREGGLVALRCSTAYRNEAERWYLASVDQRGPGALVSIATVWLP